MPNQASTARVRTRPSLDNNAPKRMAKFETWPIEKLHGAPSPVRRRGKGQAGALAASVGKFGIVLPIPITADGEIIDGHGLLQAAKDAGYTEMPVAIVDLCSEAEIKTLRIALNKLGERGDWDLKGLAADVGFIWNEDPLLAGFTGFEMPEIDALLGFVQPVADEEDIPALGEVAVSRLGDLWSWPSGSRLLCGDAKDETSYERVLAGLVVQMVLSDPPYGIAIKNAVRNQREFKEGSGMSAKERLAFFRDFLNAASPHIPKGCIVDLFIDFRGSYDLQTAASEIGLELVCIPVWDKGVGGMGGLYRHQTEQILVLKRPGAANINNIHLGGYGRNRTTLWSAPGNAGFGKHREAALKMHSTVKPVSLLKEAILDTSNPGGVVCDPFCGSGSTLVAAHQTRRVGVGIEFDPLYVDVAVRRFQDITGEAAVLDGAELTFDEIAAQRLSTSAE